MELLYLWIENYKSIKQQGFNFGGQYSFDFDYKTGKLSCEDNSLFINDFFGSKVKNITALIGKNGSGKSTFLDFIKQNISVDIGVTNLRYLCLFKVNDREEIFIYNSTQKEIKLPKDKETLFSNAPGGRIDGDLVSLRNLTAFIFYSPILDFNFYPEYSPFDISSTNLLREIEPSEFQATFKNSLDYLIYKDVRSQLHFASHYSKILPFDLPVELIMNPNPLDEGAITRHYNFEEDSFIPVLSEYRKIIKNDLYEKRGERELYYTEISESIFWHTIRYLLVSDHKTELSKFLSENSFKSTTNNPTGELLSLIYAEKSLNKFLPDWSLIQEFFDLLRSLEKEEIMNYVWARFNFEIRQEQNFKKVDSLLKVYFQLSVVGDFLRFNWPGLSSGQQSIFAMFSRFYQLKEELIEFVNKKNELRVEVHGMSIFEGKPEVIIMLDEAESHLHPQWQKEYIDLISKYLPDIIGVPKIQIILASNSPFLISDLPEYNVIFLEEEEEEGSKVQQIAATTFAANIHELLSQSFFLDSTIGRVAENKINEVIQLLNQDEELSSDQVVYVKKVIRLINDPLVQDKLLQLLSLKIENNNWEEYLLIQQRKLIDEKLSRLHKNRGNAEN